MTAEQGDQESPKTRIELEPLELKETQRHVGTPSPSETEAVANFPVPSQPVHLCPNCDYNLTGLTSRRCPECGEAFTLGDARMEGMEHSPSMKELRRIIRVERVKVWGGLAMMLIGLSAPNIAGITRYGWPRIRPTCGGLVVQSLLFPLVVTLLVFRLRDEGGWGNVLLIGGCVFLVVGLWIAL